MPSAKTALGAARPGCPKPSHLACFTHLQITCFHSIIASKCLGENVSTEACQLANEETDERQDFGGLVALEHLDAINGVATVSTVFEIDIKIHFLKSRMGSLPGSLEGARERRALVTEGS